MTTEREPRTEAGRRMLAYLDDVGRTSMDSSFPDAEDRILAIEAEAAREALERVRQTDEAGLLREAEEPVLDWTYGEAGPTYDLPGRCLNCGQRFTVRRPKGWDSPLYVECPSCECSVYGWRDDAAIFARSGQPARLLLGGAQGPGLPAPHPRLRVHRAVGAVVTDPILISADPGAKR